MNINKGVKEALYHDPILEASQEHLCDQVMEKMVSLWKYGRHKHVVQTVTLVVM